MSPALDTWYSFADLDRLAQLARPLDGEIAIGKLARLAALLSSSDGAVNATMSVLPRPDGRLELRLDCSADIGMTCQRCLEPMPVHLHGNVGFLVADEEAGQAVEPMGPGGIDVLALAGERLNPKELIEDELLVSLPFVPRHEDERECGRLAQRVAALDKDDAADAGRIDN